MSSDMSDKQKELVKRLEKIRQEKRATEEPDTPSRVEKAAQKKRNQQQGKRQKTTKGSRNKKRQRNRPSKQHERQVKEDMTKSAGGAYDFKRAERETARKKAETAAYKRKQASFQKKKGSSKNTGTLLNQLSDGDNLADAMILSEILSKPVALRKR